MVSGTNYLSSRFGKRTFGLLITLIIIPIAVAVFFAFVNLEYELRQQGKKNLHRSAKDFGFSVLQRLILIKREAAYGVSDVGADPLYDPPFHIIAGIPDKLLSRIENNNSAIGEQSNTDSRPLLYAEVVNKQTRVFLIYQNRNPPIVAELELEFLWGPEDHLPLPHICITGADLLVLHCSSHTAEVLLADSVALRGEPKAGGETGRTVFEVDMDGHAYLGYSWNLFLSADFVSPDWRVYAFQARSEAFAPIDSFERLFIPAITALIAGTLLFGIIQIRRRLKPLDQLVTGTRQVANRDFDTRIDIQSGDEFEDLADAFNRMTRRVGKQVSTLKTLSTIDKTILKTVDVEIVLTHIFRSLTELTSPLCTAIVLVGRDSPDRGQVYYSIGEPEPVLRKRVKMDFGGIDWQRHRDGLHIPGTHSDIPFLVPLKDSGAQSYFAFPFFTNEQLDGIVCIGTAGTDEVNTETIEIVTDLSDRLAVAIAADKKERQLQRQATYDSLTGLPNRFLLKDRLERAIIHSQATNRVVAVLFLDLDRFKNVNDTLGHTLGDQLLKEAASRLSACAGRSDTVARLGGDEFVVLVSDVRSVNSVVKIARRIVEIFKQPIRLVEREIMVGASIGIALFPQDGENSEDLLRSADIAMYAAKSHGRGSYFFFDQAMNLKLRERAEIESELWRAVRDKEFELWYQPQLDINDGRVRGAEALLRWRHPTRGVVSPDQFVPLAEELGLIERIGSQSLEMACKQYLQWRSEGLVLDRIAVNVSPREFTQEDYVNRVYDTLAEFKMPPLRLTLEITENLLIHDTEKVMDRLFHLKELGVSFSVDDFGIGYSSLAYLQKLPIDTIKIDGSFISRITSDNESAAIVSAILDMAARLNISVIAEGVETQEQLLYLRESGCGQIQGYLYSKPLRPEEFLNFSRDKVIS